MQVEFGRLSLDTAHHNVFDRRRSRSHPLRGASSHSRRASTCRDGTGLHKPKDLDVFPLAGFSHLRLQETAQGWEGISAVHIRLANAASIQGTDHVLQGKGR